MILGAYYLTYPGTCKKVEIVDGKEKVSYDKDEFNDKKGPTPTGQRAMRVPERGDGKVFTDLDEMLMAYQDDVIDIHAKVRVRMYKDKTTREATWWNPP